LTQLFGVPIIQVSYDSLDLDAPALARETIPSRLEKLTRSSRPLGDVDGIARLVWKDVHALGYSTSAVATLAPREALGLATRVVGLMDYVDVGGEDFLQEFGKLTVEDSLRRGVGHCSVFAAALSEVVDVFRSVNPRLSHILVGGDIGGYAKVPHEWNAVMIRYSDRIVVAPIDALWAKRGESLSMMKPELVPENQSEFRANVALELGEPLVAERELRVGFDVGPADVAPRSVGRVASYLTLVASSPERSLQLLVDARTIVARATLDDWVVLSSAYGQAYLAQENIGLARVYKQIYSQITDIDEFSALWIRDKRL